MIFCDVRDVSEHVKNSVNHQFIEILRFNVGHREGASAAFFDGQMVNNFGDRDSSQRHVEVVFEGFWMSALGVLQTGVLLGVAVQELDLEAAFVPRPDVLGGESQVRTDECLDRLDGAVLFQFMNQCDLDHALERLDIDHSPINALPFGLGYAGQLFPIWVSGRKAVAIFFGPSLLPFFFGRWRVVQHGVVAQAGYDMKATFDCGVYERFL